MAKTAYSEYSRRGWQWGESWELALGVKKTTRNGWPGIAPGQGLNAQALRWAARELVERGVGVERPEYGLLKLVLTSRQPDDGVSRTMIDGVGASVSWSGVLLE